MHTVLHSALSARTHIVYTLVNTSILKFYKFENEVGIDKKYCNAKVGIYTLELRCNAIVLVSVLFIDPYFIFKLINF